MTSKEDEIAKVKELIAEKNQEIENLKRNNTKETDELKKEKETLIKQL